MVNVNTTVRENQQKNSGHSQPNSRACLIKRALQPQTDSSNNIWVHRRPTAATERHFEPKCRSTRVEPSRTKSKSLLPEGASNAGQQCEAQAWVLLVNLAGNIPTEAWELDLVGLVESWKHAFQSAERAKRGACSGRPSLSLFEVRGSLHRF